MKLGSNSTAGVAVIVYSSATSKFNHIKHEQTRGNMNNKQFILLNFAGNYI